MNFETPDQKPTMSMAPKDGRIFLKLGKKIYIQTVNIFLPPLAHFHTKRYTGKRRHLILDTFFALLMFALAAFVMYERATIRRFFVDDLGVKVTADQPVRAGQEHEFTVALSNETSGILTNMQVRMIPDNRFIVAGEAPSVNVAELAAHEVTTTTFRATVYGQTQDVRHLTAVITYSQETERRGQTTRTPITITDTVLGMTVTLPRTLSSGQEGELTIAPTETIFRNGSIRLESSSPVSISKREESKEYEWTVTDKTTPIQTTLRFTSDALGEHALTLSRHMTVNGKDVVTDRQQFLVTVLRPEATISAVVGAATLEPNASTSVSVTVANTGNHAIRDMVVTCRASGSEERVTMSGEDAVVSKQTIVFSYTSIEELSSLVPSGSVILTWILTALPQGDAADRDVTLSCSLAGNQRVDETDDVAVTAYASPVTITMLPTIGFQTYALYTDVGAGPLPPHVGLPTLYRLFFKVTDVSHALTGVAVTTSLPKGILWAGNASALAGTAPTFDEQTRVVRWVASDSMGQETLEASFDVQLIPNANHIGSLLPLLDHAALTSTVHGLEDPLIKTAPRVTTELANDLPAVGKGRVAP